MDTIEIASQDSISVGFPYQRGKKRCKACGRYVSGRYIVEGEGHPSWNVCNINCGLKICR